LKEVMSKVRTKVLFKEGNGEMEFLDSFKVSVTFNTQCFLRSKT
jgi:hypothetical protein